MELALSLNQVSIPLLLLLVSWMSFLGSYVIDSKATDHMTHSSQKFSAYGPCHSNEKIATVDGSLTTVRDLVSSSSS